METADVAIIGAGVHGAAAAYHLAARGVGTVVYERGVPAGGPTGRSSAVCRAYYTNEFLARMARDSIRMMAGFEDLTGQNAGYRRTGALFLHPESDRPQVAASVERLAGLEIRTEIIEPADLPERFPAFDPEGVGLAVWELDAGYSDPVLVTTGLLSHARRQGVRLRSNCQVRIEPLVAGGAVIEASDSSRLEAARVLIAAGPWTRELALQVGVDLPLGIERHVVATLGRPATNVSGPMVPTHADIPGGYYSRPEGEDLFLIGSLHPGNPIGPDDPIPPISPAEIEALVGALAGRVPAFGDADIRGGWASLYDVSPDWQPVIGEIAPGIFVDAGTSGHGFKLAPALGGQVAAMVLSEETDPGLEQFGPARFGREALIPGGYGEALILG
jgi:sarcosine oxidase subunit beta